MRILVMSPEKGHSGCTTTALLITAYMAEKYTSQICYMTADTGNTEILNWFGISEDEDSKDITTSASQVFKMLKTKSMSPDELPLYTTKVGNDTRESFHMFELYDHTKSSEEMASAREEILKNSPFIHTFVEVQDFFSLSDEEQRSLASNCDLAIMVINQDIKIVESALNRIRGNEYLSALHFTYVVNKFNSIISSESDFTKRYKDYIPKKETLPLHYNPKIPAFQNDMQASELMSLIVSGHTLLKEVQKDLDRICSLINLHSGYVGGV